MEVFHPAMAPVNRLVGSRHRIRNEFRNWMALSGETTAVPGTACGRWRIPYHPAAVDAVA
jgi:hypothetical protein